MAEEIRVVDQRVSSLQQDARQPNALLWWKTGKQTPRLAIVRRAPLQQFKRCMGIAVLQTNRVDPDPMCTTSFGDDCTGPPALSCSREEALVDKGAATPKSCLSPLEMRSPIAAGGLLPTGETSTATTNTFDHPALWFYLTEETNLRTSILYILYFSSFEWIYSRQALFWPRVIETKSGQNSMSDLGGSQGRLHVCPFLETWRALLCGKVHFRPE